MPVAYYPGVPFSLSAFSSQIAFLKEATTSFIDPQKLGPVVRPLSASFDQQLMGLAYHCGASVALLLRSVEGGRYHREIDTIRSWAEGRTVTYTDFARALDTFELALEGPHRELEKELRKRSSQQSHTETLPSSLLAFLKGECQIDHGGQVFTANGVPIDPLLDPFPMPEVFSLLENQTEGGKRLAIPFLNLAVYAAPEISLANIGDLYRQVERADIAVYLLEKIVYLLPREVTEPLKNKIAMAKEAGLLSELEALEIKNESVISPAPSVNTVVPWHDPELSGALDLATVGPACDRRWIEGKDTPDLSGLKIFPTLLEWLHQYRNVLHWSDIRKIEFEKETAWLHCYRGQFTSAQLENIAIRIQGILGEIVHRQAILKEYLTKKESQPDLILLVEGEIRTADMRMTSDALIGRLHTSERALEVINLYEVTTAQLAREIEQEKNRKNVEERFVQKGLVLLNEQGKWGRVSVKAQDTHATVLSSSEKERRELRELSRKISGEILGFTTLRYFQSGIIPLEEKRRYASISGINAAGQLLASITKDLWKEIDRRQEMIGTWDLYWLELQLATRIDVFPLIGQPLLKAYLAALRNLAAALNPSGERVSIPQLATQVGIAKHNLVRYHNAVEEHLKTRGMVVLTNPMEKTRKGSLAVRSLKDILSSLWEEDKPLLEIVQALIQEIQNTSDPTLKKHMMAYLEALRNVSTDLNAEGQRTATGTIARRLDINSGTFRRYQQEIEIALSQRGLRYLPNPQQKMSKAKRVRHALNVIVASAWEEKADVAAVAQALADHITKTTDPQLRARLKAYVASLQNVSSDLNPSGQRMSAAKLAAQYNVHLQQMLHFQVAVEVELTQRGLAVIPDPKLEMGKSRRASHALRRILPAVWSGNATASEALSALEAEIEKAREDSVLKLLQAYTAALQNVSADLNPTGQRLSTTQLAAQSQTSAVTIGKYEEEIERALTKRDLPVHPKTQISKAHTAGRSLGKILAGIWAEEMPITDVAQALSVEIEKANDPALKKLLEAYQATLCNLFDELNSSGKRESPAKLAASLDVGSHLIRKYQRSIEEQSRARGFTAIPDAMEKQRKASAAGHVLKKVLHSVWDGKETVQQVERALEEQLQETSDVEAQKYLRAYLAVLRDVSPDLNASGLKGTDRSFAGNLGVDYETVRNYQQRIEARLKKL